MGTNTGVVVSLLVTPLTVVSGVRIGSVMHIFDNFFLLIMCPGNFL